MLNMLNESTKDQYYVDVLELEANSHLISLCGLNRIPKIYDGDSFPRGPEMTYRTERDALCKAPRFDFWIIIFGTFQENQLIFGHKLSHLSMVSEYEM